MSTIASKTSSGRLRRGNPPDKPIRRTRYRKVLPLLIRDFGPRCAYSMQHEERAGQLEVDHFDPRLKKELIQRYENLFPASRYCNGKKGDHWPTKAESRADCRFLNPCEEQDYGEVIFEDPVTHKLIGTTPAAIWHIRICALNADHLVRERKKRAEHWARLRRAVNVRPHTRFAEFAEVASGYKSEVEIMIPEIPAPPTTTRGV